MDLCHLRIDPGRRDISTRGPRIHCDLGDRYHQEAVQKAVTRLGLVQDAWALVLLNTPTIMTQ